MSTLRSAIGKAWLAGTSIILLGVAGRWASGSIYSTVEALDLIEAVRSSALYLGSAMATSSATTLALMLTFVGLVQRFDHEFSRQTYMRIRLIARLSAVSLVGSVLLLLILTFPVGDFEQLPRIWYPWLYNAIYSIVILVSALLVATVTLLFVTLADLISEITPCDEV